MKWTIALEGCPQRVNHAAAVVGHRIFTFGGYSNGADFVKVSKIDVHVFNSCTLRWHVCEYKGSKKQIPFQRYGHTVVVYDDKIYLWGGRNDLSACNILYCFDPKANEWSKQNVSGKIPEARDGHTACIINDHMYVFGGYLDKLDCYSQDVHSLDLKNFTWEMLLTEGTVPRYRDFHTASTINGLMYVWGGRQVNDGIFVSPHYEKYTSEMYTFNPKTNDWKTVSAVGCIPIGRRSHSTAVLGKDLYVFGGYNSKKEKHFNDLHKFNTETNEWQKLRCQGKPPPARRRQAFCIIDTKIYMFGGTSPLEPHAREADRINYFYDDPDPNLLDHGDLHVLDLDPSLKTLCSLQVLKHNLNYSCLPQHLQLELKAISTPNHISLTKSTTKSG